MTSKEQENTILNVLRPKTREEIDVLIDEAFENFPMFKKLFKDLKEKHTVSDPVFHGSEHAYVYSKIFDKILFIGIDLKDKKETITTILNPPGYTYIIKDLKDLEKQVNDL